MGGSKSQFVALLDGIVGILTALKVQILLLSFDLEDEARKLAYQAELELIQAAISNVEAPMNAIFGYTNILSDCDPVASLAAVLKNARDYVLTPVKEYQYEIEQMLAALEDKDRELEQIDRWIQAINDTKDALEACG
jgi:citrate lyase beta subunit